MSQATRQPSLLLSGGGPLGVAFQVGALLCLEDALGRPIRQVFGSIIGASAGAVTGACLSTGSSPARILRALCGRFPEEIEYFDPFYLLNFDPAQIPSLTRTLWRGGQFLLRDWWRKRPHSVEEVAARKALYHDYLESIEAVIDMVPAGWFQVDSLRGFLSRTLRAPGEPLPRSDDLDSTLLIKATDLGRGIEVMFGPGSIVEKARHSPLLQDCQLLDGDLIEAVIIRAPSRFCSVCPRITGRRWPTARCARPRRSRLPSTF